MDGKQKNKIGICKQLKKGRTETARKQEIH